MSKRVEIYVRNKVTLYCTDIISQAIKTEVINNLDITNLVQFKTNTDDIVTSIYINTNQINQILASTNESLINSIKDIASNSLTLPLGVILSDTLFFGLGPNIKIKITSVGNVTTDVLSTIKDYGINNCLLEVSIAVKANIETIIPFKKGKAEVICHIPLVIEVLQGTVPRYYYNTNDTVPFINDD